MRRVCLLLLCIALAATPSALGGQAESLPDMPNLVTNAGFEEPAAKGPLPTGWAGDVSVYSRDETGAHSEQASLRFVNPDPEKYRLCSHVVQVEHGRRYEFSAWVRTQDVKGEDSGATVCMEWSGAGKWIGGSYPGGVKGTADWSLVRGISKRIPKDADRCSITCYVRKGMTGTAWFDDVQVRRYADPIMYTALLKPGYRGRIMRGQSEAVAVRVSLNLADYDMRLSDVALRAALAPAAAGPTIREANVEALGKPTCDISIPTQGLREGPLVVRVEALRRADRTVLATEEHAICRVAAGFQATCEIDEHRRLIVDGKPFFPLGMYWSGVNEADVGVYANSAFNCLMPYGSPSPAQMDTVHQHGLRVIYSIKDFYAGSKYCPKHIKTEADEELAVRSRVRQHRSHPALLAWYLNDELSVSYMPRLNAHQRWVEEEDPNHPTWVVLYQVDDVGKYLRSFDVIGTDPYPIPRHSPSLAANWTRKTVAHVMGSRAVWMVPQVFNWANYRKTAKEREGLRPPTLAEMRSMAWQCICEGATGLIFYSYFDLKRDKSTPFDEQWTKCKTVAAEISQMAPAILSIEQAPAIEIVSGEWLHCLVRRHKGKLYIMAANDGDGEGSATFNMPGPAKAVRVLGETRTVELRDGKSFTDSFEKLAVHVYEVR